MANQKKTIQFDHFRPYYLTTDENGISHEHVYNLRALLQHVMGRPFSETKKKILGDTHMFHICRHAIKSMFNIPGITRSRMNDFTVYV